MIVQFRRILIILSYFGFLARDSWQNNHKHEGNEYEAAERRHEHVNKKRISTGACVSDEECACFHRDLMTADPVSFDLLGS